MLLGLPSGVSAQTATTVKGTVLDANTKEPLIGISVLDKTAKTGTVTDMNGQFALRVSSPSSELVFSYIGYVTQTLRAGQVGASPILMQEDSETLDEVVVVGYGTQKKVNLTGAVSQLSGKKLENRAVTSMSQALQGTIANLNISSSSGVPGQSQDINIRGYTGLGTTGSPLIVIDGVQGGKLDDINMNDVESISVLKDAASAAIYGSSAPFGVIIVTTKKGNKEGKPTITYNNNFGFSAPTNLPHYTNSLDFAKAFNEAAWNSDPTTIPYSPDVLKNVEAHIKGTLKSENDKNLKNEWGSWNEAWGNNDWFDLYFKNSAFSQQHNLGVSGGSEKADYYIGLGYNQQDGLYNWANDSYKRYNVRANISSNVTKWLKVSFRGSFSRGTQDTPTVYGTISGGTNYSVDYFHQLGRRYPTVPLKNPDGDWSEASNIAVFTRGGRNTDTKDNAVLTGEVTLTPLKGWVVTANATYDGLYENQSQHQKTIYGTRPDGSTYTYSGTSPNSLTRRSDKNQHYVINAYTSYERTFAKKHYAKVMVGYTQELYNNFYLKGTAQSLFTDDVPSLSLAYGNPDVEEGASQLAIRGGFVRLNYSFEDKYLVEFNGRYDGTSRFLKDVRYKFYPGVSVGWVVSQEKFWKPLSNVVDFFKVRASYASLGDQSFSGDNYYPFYPNLVSTTSTDKKNSWFFGGNREAYVKDPNLVDSSLTWVTTNTLNVGVDVNLLNNRLTVGFDWYNRVGKNFVGPAATLPAVLGTEPPKVNNANIRTRGWGVTIGWKDRIGKVSYGVSAVLSDYKGKVTKYNNPDKLLDRIWYAGMNMGEIWGYETVGLFRSEEEIKGTDQSYIDSKSWQVGDVHYADLNGNGKIDVGDNTVANPGDRKVIGNQTPRYQFGVNLNAEWNGFDATVFFQGVGKRDFMFDKQANFFWGITGGGQWQSSYFTAHTDRYVSKTEWTEERFGYFPRAYFNTDKNHQSQSGYLQNAAYLRLKNIQVGYTLPRQLTRKASIEKVRVFVNGENLFTVTNMLKVVDPEIAVNKDANAKVYPLQRTWSFGINVTL
jgi:TonB-linked SusC/RagA family outer membrane protein